MPELQNGGGGLAKMEEVLRQLMPFPKEAARAAVHGTVGVQLVLAATGQVLGACIAKILRASLDTAALIAVRNLPALSPGQHLNQPGSGRYNLPLHLPANPLVEAEYTYTEHPPTLPDGVGQAAVIAAVQQRLVLPPSPVSSSWRLRPPPRGPLAGSISCAVKAQR